METKYYVDVDGNYIGGFCGEGAMDLVPEGAVEVANPPPICAWQKWNGTDWDAPDPMPT